jgi:hypothetical protein
MQYYRPNKWHSLKLAASLACQISQKKRVVYAYDWGRAYLRTKYSKTVHHNSPTLFKGPASQERVFRVCVNGDEEQLSAPKMQHVKDPQMHYYTNATTSCQCHEHTYVQLDRLKRLQMPRHALCQRQL